LVGVLDLMHTTVGKEIVDLWSSEGATVGWIGVDKVAVGVYGVADQLRTEAIEAVCNLKHY
jgi:Cd2+/Zn2+-exporting ATPase